MLQSRSKRCPILSGKGDNSGKHFPPQPMTSRDVGDVLRRGAFPSIEILETWRELLIFTITGELNNNNSNKRKKKEEEKTKENKTTTTKHKTVTVFVSYVRVDNDW